jgi:hypothetical protein
MNYYTEEELNCLSLNDLMGIVEEQGVAPDEMLHSELVEYVLDLQQ